MVFCCFFKFVQQIVQKRFVLSTHEKKEEKSSANRWKKIVCPATPKGEEKA